MRSTRIKIKDHVKTASLCGGGLFFLEKKETQDSEGFEEKSVLFGSHSIKSVPHVILFKIDVIRVVFSKIITIKYKMRHKDKRICIWPNRDPRDNVCKNYTLFICHI